TSKSISKTISVTESLVDNNIAGNWKIQRIDDATGCGIGIKTGEYDAVVNVTGNHSTVEIVNGNTLNGILENGSMTFKENYSADGTLVSSGTLTYKNGSVSGNINWTKSIGVFSCSGTSTLSGSKL
ncbi:MAG: hypothetical protein PHN45_12700, partial [Methylococcales bacterium]|nr:hypothetical protein [Methylococcales bacterium]